MKNLGKLLIISSIAMIAFYFVYNFSVKEKGKLEVNEYIEQTSIVEEEINELPLEEVVEEKKEEKRTINYTAVLEIPSINLKQGVVNSTKNFGSIDYAVSVDNNSSYPDKMGNFILYAHSGNSSIAYFKNLNKVEINNDIYVYYNGTKYHYVIYDKYDIQKTGKAKVINSDSYRYITLITCNQSKKDKQIVVVGKFQSMALY